MRLLVSLEQVFDRTPDGQVWSAGPFTPKYWSAYQESFEEVRIFARLRPTATPSTDESLTAAGLQFAPVPIYSGPLQLAARWPRLAWLADNEVEAADRVILRLPSLLALTIIPTLKARRKPHCVEVVGDPEQAFSKLASPHRLRPVWKEVLTRSQRSLCTRARAASYVTDQVLQARYGCPRYMTGISDVMLPTDAFADRLGVDNGVLGTAERPLRLVSVMTLSQLYKGQVVLLRAIASLTAAGLNVRCEIVGDGRLRSYLERLASDLKVADVVTFTGALPTPADVRAALDAAHLFVLPSFTEGMPRALLEAMARSLPCIASRVGGIPELLPPAALVEPGDVIGLADRILDFAANGSHRMACGQQNFVVASRFSEAALRPRRTAFYRLVRDCVTA